GVMRDTGTVRVNTNNRGLIIQFKSQDRVVAELNLQQAQQLDLPPGRYRLRVIPRQTLIPIEELSLDYHNRWTPGWTNAGFKGTNDCDIDIRAGAVVVVNIDVGSLPPPTTTTDHERLQGSWVAVSAEERGRPLPADRLRELRLAFTDRKVSIALTNWRT